jgi:catecholate siderophore receptor
MPSFSSLRASFFLGCALAAFPAQANNDTSNDAKDGASNDAAARDRSDHASVDETIIVTGNVLYADQVNALKSPTPIIDVPQSLSIATSQQIEERGFTSVRDIVDYTPGVITSQGEGHRDAIVFRGVRSTADFFIDGVRDDVQYYRSLYNLEQVEILRGPNALLFGRGGTGGILNRVTKKATIGENFGGAQVAIDTFGEYSLQGDINLAAGEDVAVRLNASYESLANHRDFYDGERIGFNPTVRFAMSADTTLDLSYEYANHDRFIDRGIPTGSDGRPVEAFRDIVFGDPEENFNQLEAHLLRANLQHRFSDNVKANFSAFYGDYDKVYSNFYASGYDQIASPNAVTLDGYIDTTQRQNLILSGNLVSEFETGSIGHTLVAGAEYISTSSDQDRFNPVWDQTNDDLEIFAINRPLNLRGGVGVNALGNPTVVDLGTDLNDFTRVTIDVVSAYVQDEIKLADWLNIVLGARFDSFDITVNNVPAADIRTRTDQEISPRAGVILKPQESLSIYASYSESFLPRSGEQFANINGSNNALEPDRFTNLEAGIKWDIRPDLSFTAAVFDIEQSSPQPNDNDPSTLDIVDSNIQGFEVQLQGQLSDFWTVSAGYSFLDGEQQSRTGPTGLRPRELPDSTFAFWNRFQITDRFGIGLGATYQSDSFITNANTAVLPDYLRVDAAAYYEISDNLRIQVNIENVMDELYFPNAHSTHQASVGAPLNARFAISGTF